MNPIILIPARLAATRLPNKPLADTHGRPMIVHVWRRSVEAGIGKVLVATDSAAISETVKRTGGCLQMARTDHHFGSDRVHETVTALDPTGQHDAIVNVQGDFPTISPATIGASLVPLMGPVLDIATPVAPISSETERTASQVVKMVGSELSPGRFCCMYFTRAAAPWGEGPLWHHIGLYAWWRAALARFVSLPPSKLECREKLEQLRALEAGMRADAVAVGGVPLGVETPEDLERAREILA